MSKDELIIQAIVESARELIRRYGLQKTTMEDIAKAAGKGKSTLYYYFKSKEEIFDEVIKQETEELFNLVKRAVEKAPGPVEKMRAYMITRIKELKKKVNLYRLTIETNTVPFNEQQRRLRDLYDQQERELLTDILMLGIEKKVFRVQTEEDMDLLAELMVTCFRGVEMDMVTRNRYKTLDEKADLLVEILTMGLNRRTR